MNTWWYLRAAFACLTFAANAFLGVVAWFVLPWPFALWITFAALYMAVDLAAYLLSRWVDSEEKVA